MHEEERRTFAALDDVHAPAVDRDEAPRHAGGELGSVDALACDDPGEERRSADRRQDPESTLHGSPSIGRSGSTLERRARFAGGVELGSSYLGKRRVTTKRTPQRGPASGASAKYRPPSPIEIRWLPIFTTWLATRLMGTVHCPPSQS